MTDSTPSLSIDEIRPYHDAEVPAVLHRISHKASFFHLMGHLVPEFDRAALLEALSGTRSVAEFQARMIHRAMRGILAETASGLTVSGTEALDAASPRLFIANHRDIILDSAILNVILHEHGLPTSRIAIGDNLMVSQLVTDLMRLNKSFIVHRTAPIHLMQAYAQRLSRYIRESIRTDGQSVWLAQRSGRTKDGRDETHTGLLKMLSLSGPPLLCQGFAELHVTPVVISYEYEPCDMLKAEELVHQSEQLPYTKDDKLSMIRGIRDPKGRIHLGIGNAVELPPEPDAKAASRNAWLRELAARIDREIRRQYRLWPTHFAAWDLLHGSSQFAGRYTAAERAAFEAHVEARLLEVKGSRYLLRRQLLEIYANAVDLCLPVQEKAQEAASQ
jgi:1-acyl-sn-glycerol-3-phosphate acyltransferase